MEKYVSSLRCLMDLHTTAERFLKHFHDNVSKWSVDKVNSLNKPSCFANAVVLEFFPPLLLMI